MARTISATDPININIGRRIREARIARGVSNNYIAQKIGVSYQQFMKYECSTNYITVSKLYAIANALDLPFSYFLEEEYFDSQIRGTLSINMIRAFNSIKDENVKELINKLVKALGGECKWLVKKK
jgi:transcriptional regulator with XRE-family HTH domain